MSRSESAVTPTTNGGQAVPLADVIEREMQAIRDLRHPGRDINEVQRSLVGLALSGGGIRSATTNLGVLQALSRMDILPMVDYLSTVSGGGYIGACLTSLLSWNGNAIRNRGDSNAPFEFKDQPPPFSTDWASFPFRTEFIRGWDTRGEAQVAHLRTHGNFLISRMGLLRRETLRGIGAILLGTTFNIGYFVLTLFTLAALYMWLVLSLAPRTPAAMHSNLTHGAAAAVVMDSAHARAFTTSCVEKDEDCLIEQHTALGSATLTERLQHNLMVARDGLVRSPRVRSLLGTAATGGAVFSAIVMAVMLLAVRHRAAVAGMAEEIPVGDSAEDRSERRLLQRVAIAGLAALLLLGVGPYLIYHVRSHWLGDEQVAWVWTTFVAVAGMWVIAFVANAIIPTFTKGTRRRRSVWHAWQGMVTYGAIASFLVGAMPPLVYALVEHKGALVGGAAGAIAIARFLVPRLMASSGRFQIPAAVRRALLAVALTSALFLTFVAFAVITARHYEERGLSVAWWVVPLSAFILLGFFVSANFLSPHYFYRDRLAETYQFTERAESRGGLQLMRDAMEMRLVDLHGVPPQSTTPGERRMGAPYHLISAAINLAGSRNLTRKDRKSGYWLFSKLFCGSVHTGFVRTDKYRGGDLRLAQAVAISGAAASAAAGFNTFFAQALAAVLFNARLGIWFENPSHPDAVKVPSKNPLNFRTRFWPKWLLKEIAMATNEDDALVNLSDGGHTGDNIGIYPLLERRCKVIIACDAECDGGLAFGSFTEALRHAYVDMGIAVDIDLTMIRPDTRTGLSRGHCAVGRIRYPDRPSQESYLIYLKNSLTGDEPEPILNYKTREPAFPHESTADQFFNDDQFESYRALGVHIAEDAFGDWVASKDFELAFTHHGAA